MRGRVCSKSQRLIVLLAMASARHTTQERRQTHEAATSAAEEGARLALKAAEHAAKLRQDALKEREELKKKNQLTFSQKVGAALTDGSEWFLAPEAGSACLVAVHVLPRHIDARNRNTCNRSCHN